MTFNPRSRAHEAAVQLRMMAALERSLFLHTRKELRRAAIEAAATYKAGGSIDNALLDHAPRLSVILAAHHRTCIQRFGQRVFASVPRKSAGARERKDADGFFAQAEQDWIARWTAQHVSQISRRTRELIREAIASGEQEGLGVDAIARLIVNEMAGSIARARAETIARTETHQAAMYGSEMAADALQIPDTRKEWISIEDERTRPAHDAANGQAVSINGEFTVGGEQLDRPGDPDASPENVINCRCLLAFITPGYE